jgi:Lamin Tail Domain
MFHPKKRAPEKHHKKQPDPTMSFNNIKIVWSNMRTMALLVLLLGWGANATIVFNEIMLNPLNPEHGQWFELHNTDNTPISLQNWSVCASNGATTCFYFPPTATIGANGFLTIGKSNAAGFVDLVWNDMPSFPTSGGSTFYFGQGFNGMEIMRGFISEEYVYWNAHSYIPMVRLPFSSQPGTSLSRKNALGGAQYPVNWSSSTVSIQCVVGNDKATPGEGNDKTCPAGNADGGGGRRIRAGGLRH